ncbi:MAG: hypothetical protein ACRC33_01100 [Gemmataceae bacterium]
MARLCLLLLLLAAVPAAGFVAPPPAVPELPDLIPADSEAVLGFPDLPRFADRVDALVNGLGKRGWGNAIRLYADLVFGPFSTNRGPVYLGVIGGVRFLGRPCRDLAEAEANLSIPEGELKPGKVRETPTPERIARYGLFVPDQVFGGYEVKALEAVKASKRLRPVVSAGYARAMSGADIVLHHNPRADHGPAMKSPLLRKVEGLDPQDAEEVKAAKQMEALQASIRWLLLTIRIDRGVGFRLRTEFDGDLKPDALALLRTLQAGSGRSTLAGLPTGRVLVAHAASADGAANSVPATLLSRALLRGGATAGLIRAADHPLATGSLSVLWRQFKGRRLAVYHNADEARHGLFSLVAVLDAGDPKRALDEIADLARFAGAKDLDPSGPDAAALRRLVADLDSDEYQTREAASTKLMLAGDAALPLLTKAASAGPPEQRRRAKRVVAVLDARRAAAAAGEAARLIRPGFVLQRAAEKLDGHDIDVVSVRLSAGDSGLVPFLRTMAGPEWGRVRLAAVGKKVILMVGSDVSLFGQTLRNVKGGQPGLETDPGLARFREHADGARRWELHVALESADALTGKGIDPPKLKAGELSSLAVTLDRERFEANAWMTPAGFKAVLEKWGGR